MYNQYERLMNQFTSNMHEIPFYPLCSTQPKRHIINPEMHYIYTNEVYDEFSIGQSIPVERSDHLAWWSFTVEKNVYENLMDHIIFLCDISWKYDDLWSWWSWKMNTQAHACARTFFLETKVSGILNQLAVKPVKNGD